jgi:hypothetical protein
MMKPTCGKSLLAAIALALLAPWAGVQAQTYPSKPIQLVIPFPPRPKLLPERVHTSVAAVAARSFLFFF